MGQLQAHQGGEAASRVIDLLLVTFNSEHLLERLRQAIDRSRHGGLALRLLAVDNGSRDRSAAILKASFGCDVLIRNRENVGFGRANNQLLEHVRADYALLLNTDAFVSPQTIASSVAYLDAHPRCGIVGVRLTDSDGSLQPSRRSFPTPITTFLRRTGLQRVVPLRGARHDLEEDHAEDAECDWVPGCFYLVRRALLDEIGLFDPRFFLYFEEVDHCRRARKAGWGVTYLASSSVVHLGGESAKSVARLNAGRQISSLQVESELLYMRKHFGRAGLCLHLALVAVGDVILALKDLARGRSATLAVAQPDGARLTWRLARNTAWGTRATR